MDYKEQWSEAYEEGREKGLNDLHAMQYADDAVYDIMADIADMARLRDKYGEQF